MNTKNGKCGVFAALTAALLVTVALITSCPAPEEVIVYRDGYQPENKNDGWIRINLPEFSGRTVLPAAGAWTSFDLEIKKYDALTGGNPTLTIPKTVSSGNIGDPIDLAPGFYEVTVTASVGTSQEAAVGTSLRYAINPGTGTHIPVVIKPLPYSETANGIFEYTVTYTGITGVTATIAITALVDGDTSYDGSTSTPVTAGPHPVNLKPGSYSVFLEATTSGGKTASITEIVNIHQNLKSSVTFDFNGDFFVAFIIVEPEYKADDVKPELAQGIALTEVVEGDTITLSLDTVNGGATPDSVTITITNDTEFTEIRWYCGGSTNILNTGDDSFTITAGTTGFEAPVKYLVTAVGVTTDGAYSTSFKVEITD